MSPDGARPGGPDGGAPRQPAGPAVIDAEAIRAAVGPDEAIDAVRAAFRAMADRTVSSPMPWHLEIPDRRGEVHVKGGYLGGEHIAVKLATGFYGNPERGLPSADGLSLVLDAATGTVGAVLLDGGYLTDLRTGAAGAIATDLLARRDATRVAVIGVGGQARFQLECLARLRRPTEVVVWGRREEPAHALAGWARSVAGWTVRVARSVADAVADADMIITVTPARQPLLTAAMVRPGTHITAVGSDGPGKRELHPDLVRRADLVAVDSMEQSRELGELQGLDVPPDRLVTIGEVLVGTMAGRTADRQVTIADLTGIGAEDVAIAGAARTLAAAARSRNAAAPDSSRPGDPGWPSPNEWPSE